MVISVTYSADHTIITSDSLITPAKKASVFFILAREPRRPTRTVHVDESRRVFPNLRCGKIVCVTTCSNRRQHSSIDSINTSQLWTNDKKTPHLVRLWLRLRQRIAAATIVVSTTSSCLFPRRHSETARVQSNTTPLFAFPTKDALVELSSFKCQPTKQTSNESAIHVNQCHATKTVKYDYLSWIVLLSHACELCISECG